MAYISTTAVTTNFLTVYLTKRGRDIMVRGNGTDLTFDTFSIGDNDINYRITPKDRFVPSVTGDITGCIFSLAPNIDVKSKIFKTTGDTSNFYTFMSQTPFAPINQSSASYQTLTGDSINFLVSFQTGTTQSNHLYKTFNLPITANQKTEFDGKYAFTAIEEYNTPKALFISIPQNSYNEMIDGKNIRITLPSLGVDNVIVSSFFNNGKGYDYNNALISDDNTISQEFGYNRTTFDNKNTNVAYLFSDSIKRPITTGTTWNVLGDFSLTGKQLAVFRDETKNNCGVDIDDLTYDISVGLVLLDRGLICITNQEIIQDFYDYIISLGTFNQSQIDSALTTSALTPSYFTLVPSQQERLCKIEYKDINVQYQQTATIYLKPTEFNYSKNPTFNTGDNIYISDVGLYNSNKELIAYGRFARPVLKSQLQPFVLNVNLKI